MVLACRAWIGGHGWTCPFGRVAKSSNFEGRPPPPPSLPANAPPATTTFPTRLPVDKSPALSVQRPTAQLSGALRAIYALSICKKVCYCCSFFLNGVTELQLQLPLPNLDNHLRYYHVFVDLRRAQGWRTPLFFALLRLRWECAPPTSYRNR